MVGSRINDIAMWATELRQSFNFQHTFFRYLPGANHCAGPGERGLDEEDLPLDFVQHVGGGMEEGGSA